MTSYILSCTLILIVVTLVIFNRDDDAKRKANLKILYKKSVELQRNGKLKEYGEVMSEIKKLEETL